MPDPMDRGFRCAGWIVAKVMQPLGRIRRVQMITGGMPELGHFRPSGAIDQVGTRIASSSGIVWATPSLIRRIAPVSVRPSNVPART